MGTGPTFTFGDQPRPPAAPGPTQSDRIRATARARFGAAGTVAEQFAAGYDYVRAAAAAARRVGLDPDPRVVEANRALIAAGDAITDAIAGRVS